MQRKTARHRLLIWISASALLVCGLGLYPSNIVRAIQLGQRRAILSDSAVGASGVAYDFSFNISIGTSIGSIEFEFCENDPFIGTPCTPPTGFNAASAVLSTQSGETGFSIDGSSTANRLLLTRPASVTTNASVNYVFDGLTNPSVREIYYVRVGTFATTDGTGPFTDFGGIALYTTRVLNITTEVPPFLEFCAAATISGLNCSTASGNLVNFGNFSINSTSSAVSQMVAATNADFGYAVSVNGTTMTSGNHVINALPIQTASLTGASQFGLNLRANTFPLVGADPVGPGVGSPNANYGVQNVYRFNSGDTVAQTPGTSDYTKFTVSYIVNVSANQPAGIYATTLSYVCLANF